MDKKMYSEKDTLQRVSAGLYHLQKGLAVFVTERMSTAHGPNWLHLVSRPQGVTRDAPLDLSGFLKCVIDHWSDVFSDAFARDDRPLARSFISLALKARNVSAHHAEELKEGEALGYLHAMHQLLILTNAPFAEVTEIKNIYGQQMRADVGYFSRPHSHLEAGSPNQSRLAAGKNGTIALRLLEYVRLHPDLDDDELSMRLGIRTRQSVNMTARQLEKVGFLRRFHGPRGKIVNRATDKAQ